VLLVKLAFIFLGRSRSLSGYYPHPEGLLQRYASSDSGWIGPSFGIYAFAAHWTWGWGWCKCDTKCRNVAGQVWMPVLKLFLHCCQYIFLVLTIVFSDSTISMQPQQSPSKQPRKSTDELSGESTFSFVF